MAWEVAAGFDQTTIAEALESLVRTLALSLYFPEYWVCG